MKALIAAATTVVCAMTACGGADPVSRSPGKEVTGAPNSFEQVAELDLGGAHALKVAMALGDEHAFFHNDDEESTGGGSAITAYRLSDGKITWRTPTSTRAGWQAGTEPGDTTLRVVGRSLVVLFPTSSAGEGTSAGRHSYKVVAYDTATGRQLWATEFAKGNGPHDLESPGLPGADDRHVLATGHARDSTFLTVLINARTGAIIWEDRGLEAFDLEPGVVVGLRSGRVVGKAATAEGRQLWERDLGGDVDSLSDPGPGMVNVAPGMRRKPAEMTTGPVSVLLDPATGRTKAEPRLLLGCVPAGRGAAVCEGEPRESTAPGPEETENDADPGPVLGLDLASGRRLWQLPDPGANRDAPSVASAWRGVIYGAAPDPVAVDARTGKDLNTRVGAAPDMVNDRYGLLFDERMSQWVRVYRAIR
ncbi:PQQ-binding-like beta-propeller repeat protein [Spirillospora sp. CA-294931]|uniref:outer membrane protein assembly factor BamB family protein n=1 Tax=Spirillospora sp. CA-294931 TaxID=3240042 RepID=UPI003D905558